MTQRPDSVRYMPVTEITAETKSGEMDRESWVPGTLNSQTRR